MIDDLLNRHLEPQVDRIFVPAFDSVSVRARFLRLRRISAKRRAWWLGGALAFAVSAAAIATTEFTHLQVTNRYHNWQLFGPVKVNLHPTQSALVEIQRRAPYRIVWPAALPKGTRLKLVTDVASEVVLLGYDCPIKGNLTIIIAPRNPAVANPNLSRWLAAQRMSGQNAQWQLPTQTVRLGTDCLTSSQIAKIKSAMISRSY